MCAQTFRVTNVSPIFSMVKSVKQGYRCDAGPTGCRVSKGVKNSLWADAKAYMTAEGALNADARYVAPVVDGLPEGPPWSSIPIARSFQTARAPRGSSAEYLDSFSPVDDMRKRSRELQAPVWST